jgi:hypothetical protein
MSNYKVTADATNIKLDVKKVEYAISLARTGGQGASGPATSIGGLAIDTSDIGEGDLLTVSSQKWINVKRTNITDGGNF